MWAPRFNPFVPPHPPTTPALEAERFPGVSQLCFLKYAPSEKKFFYLTLGHCGLSVLNRAVSVCQFLNPNSSPIFPPW